MLGEQREKPVAIICAFLVFEQMFFDMLACFPIGDQLALLDLTLDGVDEDLFGRSGY